MYRPNDQVWFGSAHARLNPTTPWTYALEPPHRWREGRVTAADGVHTVDVDLTELIVGTSHPPPRSVVPRHAVKPRNRDSGTRALRIPPVKHKRCAGRPSCASKSLRERYRPAWGAHCRGGSRTRRSAVWARLPAPKTVLIGNAGGFAAVGHPARTGNPVAGQPADERPEIYRVTIPTGPPWPVSNSRTAPELPGPSARPAPRCRSTHANQAIRGRDRSPPSHPAAGAACLWDNSSCRRRRPSTSAGRYASCHAAGRPSGDWWWIVLRRSRRTNRTPPQPRRRRRAPIGETACITPVRGQFAIQATLHDTERRMISTKAALRFAPIGVVFSCRQAAHRPLLHRDRAPLPGLPGLVQSGRAASGGRHPYPRTIILPTMPMGDPFRRAADYSGTRISLTLEDEVCHRTPSPRPSPLRSTSGSWRPLMRPCRNCTPRAITTQGSDFATIHGHVAGAMRRLIEVGAEHRTHTLAARPDPPAAAVCSLLPHGGLVMSAWANHPIGWSPRAVTRRLIRWGERLVHGGDTVCPHLARGVDPGRVAPNGQDPRRGLYRSSERGVSWSTNRPPRRRPS
jgi:hypothetical protein